MILDVDDDGDGGLVSGSEPFGCSSLLFIYGEEKSEIYQIYSKNVTPETERDAATAEYAELR